MTTTITLLPDDGGWPIGWPLVQATTGTFNLLPEALPFIRAHRLFGKAFTLSDTAPRGVNSIELFRGPSYGYGSSTHWWIDYAGYAFGICDERLADLFGKLPRKLWITAVRAR